jgi:hypothetical protein
MEIAELWRRDGIPESELIARLSAPGGQPAPLARS